jgi:hypothetical protein
MAPPRRRYASSQRSNCSSKDCFADFAVGRRPVVNYRPGSIPASTAGEAGYQVSDSFRRRHLGGLRRSPEAASDVVERGGGAVGCDFAAKSVASMPAGVGHGGSPPGRVGRLSSAVSPDP